MFWLAVISSELWQMFAVNGKWFHSLFLFSLVNISFKFLFLKNPSFCNVDYRLVDVASHYYDLSNFPNCEAKRVLEKLFKKREREKEESKNRKWTRIIFSHVNIWFYLDKRTKSIKAVFYLKYDSFDFIGVEQKFGFTQKFVLFKSFVPLKIPLPEFYITII